MNNLLTLLSNTQIQIGLKQTVKNDMVKLYDSTLRDGAQTKGVNFSFNDKLRILKF